MQHAGTVTCGAHGRDKLIVGDTWFGRLDRGLFRCQTNVRSLHARNLRQRRFDARHATGAMHALDIKLNAAHG
jgi:hypothetical protein